MMADPLPCRYCGSRCMTVCTTSPASVRCTRCMRSVRAPTLEEAVGIWSDGPMTLEGLPWPIPACPQCGAAPVLASGEDGHTIHCPGCGCLSGMSPYPYDAMLAWRDIAGAESDDRCGS